MKRQRKAPPRTKQLPKWLIDYLSDDRVVDIFFGKLIHAGMKEYYKFKGEAMDIKEIRSWLGKHGDRLKRLESLEKQERPETYAKALHRELGVDIEQLDSKPPEAPTWHFDPSCTPSLQRIEALEQRMDQHYKVIGTMTPEAGDAITQIDRRIDHLNEANTNYIRQVEGLVEKQRKQIDVLARTSNNLERRLGKLEDSINAASSALSYLDAD